MTLCLALVQHPASARPSSCPSHHTNERNDRSAACADVIRQSVSLTPRDRPTAAAAGPHRSTRDQTARFRRHA